MRVVWGSTLSQDTSAVKGVLDIASCHDSIASAQ
jgi:hypothetical protein